MRQTSFHSAGVTGCTESRPSRTSAISESFGFALTSLERRRVRHIAHGADVDALPARIVGGGVGVGKRADLGDADDVQPLVGMVEEAEIADLHGAHVVAGGIVAHAIPLRAGLALGLQHLEREI